MTRLSDWHEVIQKQGDRHREEQEALVEKMETLLPDAISALSAMSDTDLIDYYTNAASNGDFNPKIRALWHKLGDEAKAELLRRLEDGWKYRSLNT